MKNKYYKPEITEFHVGFEYEADEEWDDEWTKKILEFEHGWIEIPDSFAENKRVKYLDKSDIEECGFKLESDLNFEYIFRHKNGCTLHKPKSCSTLITIFLTETIGVSNIIINNKSVLKQVLQMLNIK